MPTRTQNAEVIVIGAGIIGLAVAWRARERGMSVTVLERDVVGSGASRVAAGMLAPVSEVEFGDAGRRMLELALRSAQLWPAFASELEAATGETVALRRTGTLMVARDGDAARELERQLAFRNSLGLRASRVAPSRARELEPALAPTIRLALELPDDHSVDPRLALVALRRAAVSAGVELREHTAVSRLRLAGERVDGIELEGGERLRAGAVVIAAGSWSAELGGLPAEESVPVRPVKGQTLRLRDRAGAGLVARAVRFEGGYLVPRVDGRYVLGSTVEERGFDETPTAGGAYELLRDCHELIPGVSELEIEELCVGLRPGTPDNLPALGLGAIDGLIWATGHYRNGILLAPLTAALILEVLTATQPLADPMLAACAPTRFAGAAAHARAAQDGRRRESPDGARPSGDPRTAVRL